MASESELAAQTILISALAINALKFVLKLYLLRCGPKIKFSTSVSKGLRMQLVFVDEESTKIQTTILGKHIQKFEKLLEVGKSYFIVNGKVGTPNSSYLNVNTDKEFSFTSMTDVKQCTVGFSTCALSAAFYSLSQIDYADEKCQIDVVGILLHVRGVVEKGRSARREITITDELNDRKTVTLWGDHAKHEGAELEKIHHGRPVVAFCNMRPNKYLGIVGLKITILSSILVDANFAKATELQNWHQNMMSNNVDITMLLTKQFRDAKRMDLADILDSKNDSSKNVYVKFDATLSKVNDIHRMWYPSCPSCTRKVNIEENSASCAYCGTHDMPYEY